jgi:uncharacterized protein (TIGR00369 family)
VAIQKGSGRASVITIPGDDQQRVRQFFEWANIEVTDAANGWARGILHVQPHHRGGGGTDAVNGGIGAYMFDGLMGVAVRSTWDASIVGQVTVSLTVDYLRPLIASRQVVGQAWVDRRGRTTVFAHAELYTDAHDVAMRAHGIYRLFPARYA